MLVIMAGNFAFAAGTASLPAALVSNVTVTSPVVRSTPAITVSAEVTPSFDVDSGPFTATSCSVCNAGNNFCGYGSNAVKSQQVLTTTTTTVGNTMTIVKAAPEFGSNDPTIAVLDRTTAGLAGAAATNSIYTGTLPTPTLCTDGIRKVTVIAYLSEDLTTTTTKTTNLMSGASCSGTVVKSSTVPQPPVTLTKYGTGSEIGSYILDINPPTLGLRAVTSQPSVMQGTNKVVHNILTDGSASTNYTLVNTALGPGGYTVSAQGAGTFGPATPAGTGIAGRENDTVALYLACDAPIGPYTVGAAASTVDAALKDFDPVLSTNSDSFLVEPGLLLKDETVVVSELPPDGDYAPMTCFSGTLANRKVNTSPGSVHITAIVNTTGPCAGFSNIRNPLVSLTLPIGFSFADAGAAPKAHIFTGPAATGFDMHYPQTLKEVTSLIPKTAITLSGQTLTVDLSPLDLGLGAGVIPSTYTIYVRARAAFTGFNVPADNATYTFGSSTTAELPSIGKMTNESFQVITAMQACVNGNLN
jgi:hypothetical protein